MENFTIFYPLIKELAIFAMVFKPPSNKNDMIDNIYPFFNIYKFTNNFTFKNLKLYNFIKY